VATVKCFVSEFNLGASPAPYGDLTLGGQPIGDFFHDASGVGELDLVVDWSQKNALPGLVSSGGVSDDQLSDGLQTLLAPDSQNVANIGLLIADSYAPAPDQYGLMFDINGVNGAVGPRQGCALFLNSMQLDAPPNSFSDFVAYTAVHELGHAFNLWHLDDSSFFMQPHPVPAQFQLPASPSFDPIHASFLALANDPHDAEYVLPGQSAFGVRPAGWPAGGDLTFEGPAPKSPGVTLRIGVSHGSLWSFEPIELEVELALAAGRRKPVRVPDEIDPGYAAFGIWITRPDGERFRFRSERRFCRANGERLIIAAEPFRRDISICRHSGGYAFHVPGQHDIQASLRLRSGKTLWSNVVQCDVMRIEPASRDWAAGSTALQTRDAVRILRYKRGAISADSYRMLARFAASKYAAPATSAALHYSLGVAFLRRTDLPLPLREKSQVLRNGAKHLKLALSWQGLSRHRRRMADLLLSKLDVRKVGK